MAIKLRTADMQRSRSGRGKIRQWRGNTSSSHVPARPAIDYAGLGHDSLPHTRPRQRPYLPAKALSLTAIAPESSGCSVGCHDSSTDRWLLLRDQGAYLTRATWPALRGGVRNIGCFNDGRWVRKACLWDCLLVLRRLRFSCVSRMARKSRWFLTKACCSGLILRDVLTGSRPLREFAYSITLRGRIAGSLTAGQEPSFAPSEPTGAAIRSQVLPRRHQNTALVVI